MLKIKKICIVGTGYAAYNHFKCFNKLLKQKIIIVTRNIKSNKNLKRFNKKKVTIIKGIKNISNTFDTLVVAVPWFLNDKYLKILKDNKKPILFEKPLSLNKKNIHKISFKNNKFVALNRRYYSTIQYIKKRIVADKNKIIDVELNLSENFNLFKKRVFLRDIIFVVIVISIVGSIFLITHQKITN